MIKELEKYQQSGHFFLNHNDNLAQICNAPNDRSGVYLVYALKNGKVDLIYIGRSGKILSDGTMFIRKAGIGGIKDRIVNGHQFGKIPRRISWPKQMMIENIEDLDIYWYITHSIKYQDCPRIIEAKLLRLYFSMHGQLPKWNREI